MRDLALGPLRSNKRYMMSRAILSESAMREFTEDEKKLMLHAFIGGATAMGDFAWPDIGTEDLTRKVKFITLETFPNIMKMGEDGSVLQALHFLNVFKDTMKKVSNG